MNRLCMRIIAYSLSFVVLFISFFSAFSFPVSAGTTSDLYGTGSADDINIVKLLDMALNRGGMTMSPATIKAFLEYWYGAVKSDLTTCIDNASSTISTTEDFAAYVISALSDAEHYDQLGSIIKRYVQYVLSMGSKSVSDFKQLLLQEGTFRKFLLSYVTDENGNVVNTVKPLKTKYKTNSDFVNMVRQAADAYVKEYEGYYLIKTHKPDEFLPSFFRTKKQHDLTVAILKTISENMVIGVSSYRYGETNFYFRDYTGYNFVKKNYNSSSISFYCDAYDANWLKSNVKTHRMYFLDQDSSGGYLEDGTIVGDAFNLLDLSGSDYELNGSIYIMKDNPFLMTNVNYTYGWLCTKDGRYIKIWKSVDAMKGYSVGKSNIYYSTTYSSYDYSVDNSITFTGQYFTSNDYSHTTIQNNIDNSQDINETVVNNIVNNYIINNFYGTDVPGGGDDDPDDSGNWFADLITGIPELLAAIVDGIAGLKDKISELFISLFVPAPGFADPLFNKVDEKFMFMGQSEQNVNSIFNQFQTMGQTVPTITFPFSKTTLAKYGINDITVSFDWYVPYKPYVDTVFSAILWVMFAFNQYFAVKNIINASGNAVDIASRL